MTRLQHFIENSCGVNSAKLLIAVSTLCLSLIAASPVRAQFSSEMPSLKDAERVNERAIGIVFNYSDLYRQLINDVTRVISDGTNFRLVPVLGQSHVQNVMDLLYLKGVDLAIIHADVLTYMEKTQLYDGVFNRVRSLIKLDDKKVVIISGVKYETLQDLTFQSVNFGQVGNGADITGSLIFDALNIEVQRTRYSKRESLQKIKSGEIAAMVFLSDEPLEEFASLSMDDNVHLLGIPQQEKLLINYDPAELANNDFPGLIDSTEKIPTLSVPVVIASYNWEPTDKWRYAKLKIFVESFVTKLENLKVPDTQHQWSTVSLLESIPGIEPMDLLDVVISDIEAKKALQRVAALREDVNRVQEQLKIQLNERMPDASDSAEYERWLAELKKTDRSVKLIVLSSGRTANDSHILDHCGILH